LTIILKAEERKVGHQRYGRINSSNPKTINRSEGLNTGVVENNDDEKRSMGL
jgi:hypothetical protein